MGLGVPASRWCFVAATVLSACGSGSSSDEDRAVTEGYPGTIRPAVAAVEAALGGPQEYFEITANPQLTNVFVAIDGATAAVPYVYRDGELLDPAPTLEGASGRTFTAEAIRFDEQRVLDGVRSELPDASIDAFSVEGGPGGTVRYVVAARSSVGGALDIEVGPDGTIIAVDPV